MRTVLLNCFLLRPFCYTALFGGALLCLSGCASLMQTLGLQAPAAPQVQMPQMQTPQLQMPESMQADMLRLPRFVNFRLHAADQLNTDEQERALSLIVRVYKLRDSTAFLSAPYEAFTNPDREKEVLKNDLVEVREILLVPGQKHEVQERVPREAGFVGIVALYRTPASQRWRYAFAADDAAKSGVTLGAHACALTVSVGTPVGFSGATLQQSPVLLSQVRCPKTR